ncbi:endonuclease domain-containing protein [Amycolatopsis sp. lyj-84]|uniref:endonuclease domain-containing protein n=1 Tax=Amycolatopsis sp. lyj-84 TaxID=2789284 RepID=UPI00397A22DC
MTKPFDSSHLPDIFRGSEARKAGLITASRLRGPSVRRLFQDVYTRADVEVTHELRCRGAALLAPPEAVLTGRSAATVHGVALANPGDPVEMVVPEKHRFGPIDGIKIRRTEVKPEESKPWHGIRIARRSRIALDLLLRLSPRKSGWVRRLRIGVPDLDQFMRATKLTDLHLNGEFYGRRNRGIRLARHALRLSDPRAESPPESEVRIVLAAAGITATPQLEVFSRTGHFIARLDLGDEKFRVAIEYDGRWHNTPKQQAYDRKRRRRAGAEGWRFVIVTAEDLANDLRDVVEAVWRARRGAFSPLTVPRPGQEEVRMARV